MFFDRLFCFAILLINVKLVLTTTTTTTETVTVTTTATTIATATTLTPDQMDVKIKQFANSSANENYRLLHQWQDWILTDVLAVNHLNCLLIFGSRANYTLTVPSTYKIQYISNSAVFRSNVVQMAGMMRLAHMQANEDINRVRTGMENVPLRMRKLILDLKYDMMDNIRSSFPDQFMEVENLVNNSLIVMHRSAKNFQDVLNFITELELLLTKNPTDPSLELELQDLRDQWSLFTTLMVELSARADRARENFILQLNWILDEFVRTNFRVTDSHREFLIRLLLAKVVEIDQTCHLLDIISEIHAFMSETSVNEQISGHDSGISITNEVDRKRNLKEFRSSLPSRIVKIVRRSIVRQDQFYRKDQIRRTNIERIMTSSSPDEIDELVYNSKIDSSDQ